VTLIQPTRHWTCPNCTTESITHEPRPHTRFHTCRGLKGLTAPMVEAGTRAEVIAVERDDYVGTERVQTDAEGRPVMAVVTKRDDGEDRAVLAPVATIAARS
jgi:hypothetical protein